MKRKETKFRQLLAWTTLIIVLFPGYSIFAQTNDNAIRVGGMTATRFNPRRLDEGGINEFRWKLSYNAPLGDPSQPECVQINTSAILPDWREYYDGVDFYNSFGEIIDEPFTTYTNLNAEAWENDDDPECTYNGGDDMHCGPDTFAFRYIDYAPGIENTIQWYPCSDFGIEYKFRYSLPRPTKPNNIENGALICDDNARMLTTVTGLGQAFNDARYRFETIWEIQVGGQPWQYLGTAPVYFDFSSTSPKSNINFDFRNHPSLNGSTLITAVNYRVKTRMTVVGGAQEVGSVFESVYAYPDRAYNIGPKAPTIVSATTTPSCTTSSTGTVTVNATGFGTYRYVLRTGVNTTPCDPELGTCGSGPSGLVNSNNFTISNVAAGDYTLLVANKGGTTGVCWNYQLITVGSYTALQSTVTSANVTCFGGSNGTITIAGSGGNGPYSYRITKTGVDLTNTTGAFENLAAGTYNASVTDVCGQVVTKQSTIAAPLELQATFSNANGNCFGTSNGTFSATITQGGGRYTFQLYRNGSIMRVLSNTTLASWAHADLAAGQYMMRIYDLNVGTGQCNISSTIDITQPAMITLPAANIAITNVACNGTKGRIALVNELTAGMTYELVHLLTGTVRQPSVDFEFVGLDAGAYKIVKKRNVAGCNDRVESGQLTVEGAGSMTVTLTKTDLTCFEGGNGTLTATVVGGAPDDTYQWEISLGGSWVGLPLTGSSVSGLAAGTYRVKVSTQAQCGAMSDEITIVEPAQLEIKEVKVTGGHCSGPVGRVRVTIIGGVAPYTFLFNNGVTEISSTNEETELQDGTYTLRVTDNNNCEVGHPQNIVIGNGIPVTMTLTSKSDVKCSGDKNGEINVAVTGGQGPFVYLLNGVVSSEGPSFRSLDPGTYTVRIEDSSGCSAEVATEIQLLSLPIDLAVQKTDPKCFNSQDGSIQATVTGGVTPFKYFWNETEAQLPTLTSIGAGVYQLKVVDQQGCVLERDIEIVRPAEIELTINAVPICSGQTTGEIDIVANGGVAPYTYSIRADEFVETSLFTSVAAGDYTVQVMDANACRTTEQVAIEVRNTKPVIDFIVASKENAQDTLVIHEISIPKPTSVEWTFDPSIIVLNSDASTAQIKVLEPGAYPITMTGNFDGCVYSKTSTLQFDPFDPNNSHKLKASDMLIKQMQVNPNPTSGSFNLLVELSTKQAIAVTIYDLSGNVKYTRTWEKENGLNESLTLSSDLPVGIYIVRVVTNTDARQLQIVLAR